MASSASRLTQAYQKAQINFTAYKQLIWRRYQHPAHLAALDRALMQVSRYVETNGASGIGRLIVEMPPRSGKSLSTSRYYPTWHLGRNPDHRVMLVSYGASLADMNSRAARNTMRSPYYQAVFPGVELAPDSRAANAWNIAQHTGGMDALGIGGSATGKGASLLILDDLMRGRSDAESPLVRERTWEAFIADLYTRLEPGGAIVLMATRWHTDDPIGRALQMDGEGWRRLRFPALAEADDPLGRAQGEALWEERFPLASVERIRTAIGEYEFAALYQQQPLPSGGGLFDATKIEIVDYLPECTQVVRFWDLAVTAKKTSDYTVGLKLGVTSDETFVVLDVWRGQKEFPDVREAIVQMAHVDGAGIPVRLEAEKAGLIGLQELLRDSRMRAYVVDAVPPQGDKYSRATLPASRVNAQRLVMVRAAWNRAFIDELSVFPSGAHDDQVDALSGAYAMLVGDNVIVGAGTADEWLTNYRG